MLPALLPPCTLEMSPDTQGGAVLLGVDGICIISHGSSGETAMVNAIKLAEEMVKPARRGDHCCVRPSALTDAASSTAALQQALTLDRPTTSRRSARRNQR